MSSGQGVVLQPEQQEMTTPSDNHGPHMSIEALLEVINGANVMPVLFVPSSNGRLAAAALDGLQSLVPANRHNNDSVEDNKAFRSWLLLLMSLVATVTFNAGINTPGGFWADDGPGYGHVAGMPVMRSKFYWRYLAFYYSNTTAFFTSLMTIGMLARNINNLQPTYLKRCVFTIVVVICFMSLGGSYISGTLDGSSNRLIYIIGVFLLNMVYMFVLPSLRNWIQSRRGSNAINP